MSDPPVKRAVPNPKSGPCVLHLGLPRTGTYSMALAYRALGFPRVYHGVEWIDAAIEGAVYQENQEHYVLRAATATFFSDPPQNLTREQWDEWLGSWDVVTDVMSFFGPQLVDAYPDAKVVVMERRDVDRWIASWDEALLTPMWSPFGYFVMRFLEPLLGSWHSWSIRYTTMGFFGASTRHAILLNMRETYHRYYEEIRAKVPADRLLEYSFDQGWEPLCTFLDKDVPDVPFPRVNEAEILAAKVNALYKVNFRRALKRLGCYSCIFVGIVATVWRSLAKK